MKFSIYFAFEALSQVHQYGNCYRLNFLMLQYHYICLDEVYVSSRHIVQFCQGNNQIIRNKLYRVLFIQNLNLI